MSFFAGATEEVERRLETEMRRGGRRPRLRVRRPPRDQLATLHMAVERQQVVTETARGPRRGRHRRRAPRGGGVRLPRAPGPDRGPAGLHRRQGGGPDPGPSWWAGSSSSSTATPNRPTAPPTPRRRGPGHRQQRLDVGGGDPRPCGGPTGPPIPACPARSSCPSSPTTPRPTRPSWPTARRAGGLRVPQRGGKRSLMETVARNAARSSSVTGCGGRRTTTAGSEGPRSAPECPRAPGGPPADRVLRHEPHPGHRLRRVHGRLEDGLPRPAHYRRFRVRDVPGNDDYAAMEEVLTRRLTALLDERQRNAEDGTPAAAASPTRPSSSSSTGARDSWGWGCGSSRTGADRRDPHRRPGQDLRGGLRPGTLRPGGHPPGIRGPLPPAAGARRGPPLRHHLPPQLRGSFCVSSAACGDKEGQPRGAARPPVAPGRRRPRGLRPSPRSRTIRPGANGPCPEVVTAAGNGWPIPVAGKAVSEARRERLPTHHRDVGGRALDHGRGRSRTPVGT
jgi:hypothetical protein